MAGAAFSELQPHTDTQERKNTCVDLCHHQSVPYQTICAMFAERRFSDHMWLSQVFNHGP